jgi:hydrogenase-4 component B
VLHALAERDFKRLLAYSTVENIGIVFVALGASLLLSTAGLPAPAALAFGAALLHALNHAAFKSLLFLGAGAILQGAHTKDLEEMGGLIRRMPWTAAAALVGCAAIAGLPPLNGFAGEWLILQSLVALAAGVPGDVVTGLGAVAAAALLGLTAALALACFTKVFGGAFLALPRHHHAAAASEVPPSMRWGMGLLAAASVVLGLAAGPTFALAGNVSSQHFPAAASAAGEPSGLALAPPAVANAADAAAPLFAPVALLAGLAAAGALAVALRASLGRATRVRRTPTWACGNTLEPRMEYTPQAFADPLRLIFARAIQPFAHTEVDHAPGAPPYFAHALRYRAGVHPPIERALYQRGLRLLLAGAHQIRRVQAGSLRLYLAYMLAALAALLVWGRP